MDLEMDHGWNPMSWHTYLSRKILKWAKRLNYCSNICNTLTTINSVHKTHQKLNQAMEIVMFSVSSINGCVGFSAGAGWMLSREITLGRDAE